MSIRKQIFLYLENFINLLNPRAPKGLIKSADQWVADQCLNVPQLRQAQPSAYVKCIFPHEENTHQMRQGFETAPYDEFQNVRWSYTHEAKVFYLEGCRILGDEGVIISPDNKVFSEFNFPPARLWREHSCFRRKRIPKVKKLPGWYATIVYPESRFFFHWMLESLPRMALLKEYICLLDGIFVPGKLQSFHYESLATLGFDDAKLIPVDAGTHFQPEHLFVPNHFSLYNPPNWLHQWFKESYLSKPLPQSVTSGIHKRIYISRNDAPARKVKNENEVLESLKEFSFEVINLTEYSFIEQARLFHEAEVIVAPHGAGLSNLVFCKSGTKIIEIFPPGWMAPCFMALASITGCVYQHIIGIDDEIIDNRDPQRDDIIVPLKILEKYLKVCCT